MSFEIPKTPQGISLQRSVTPSFDNVKPQISTPQENTLKISREAVDYSTLPMSQSTQALQAVLISDKDISKLVHDILSKQQDFSPAGLTTQETLNPFQSDVAQRIKENGYPTPRALAG
jgi:hypothetical protein